MIVCLDTNVVLSGIYFRGTPGRIVDAWIDSRIELVVTPKILMEYFRAASELAKRSKRVDATPILERLAASATIVEDVDGFPAVCRDPDDDKFLACAMAAKAVLVSGDRDLLACDGAISVRVVTPRGFLAMLDSGD